MPYMRNASSGAIVGWMAADSAEYRYLTSLRSNNQPVWEDAPVTLAEVAGVVTDAKLAYALGMVMPASAAGASTSEVIGEAPFAGTISKVEYYPDATITGADTNTRTLSLVNETGPTTPASAALTNGNNMTALVSNLLTLSSTPSDLTVAVNDVLKFTSVKSGSGLADPGGLVVVTFNRT